MSFISRPSGVAPGLSAMMMVAVLIALAGLVGPARAMSKEEFMDAMEVDEIEKKIGPCPPGPYTPPPGYPKPLPRARIDLAMPPRERWNKIIDWTYELHGWEHTFENIRRYFDAVFPLLKRPLIDELTSVARKTIQHELLEEMIGATDRINRYQPKGAQNYTINNMLALNVLYEFFAGCSSIVASDVERRMWHGRTLDWPLPPGVSPTNYTYLIEWVNSTIGDDVIFRSVNMAGYVGVNTGLRSTGWSLSLDERRMPNKTRTLIENVYNMDFNHASPVTWLNRLAMQSNETFKQAVNYLSLTKTAAASYLIVAGPKNPEGAVITRGWNNSQLWLIPNGPQPWYLVQTNYDHWEPVPPYDNRRGLAEQALNKIGQRGMGIPGMKFVLEQQGNATTRGVLNANTLFSVVMNPDMGIMEGWLWQ